MDIINDNQKKPNVPNLYYWAVTGTYHGSIVVAKTEDEARKIFRSHYNSESIINIKRSSFV